MFFNLWFVKLRKFLNRYLCFACMAKIAYKKSLMDTNITILALQNFFLMDSVNIQIYKIDICSKKY
jgi:hypothetical protein